MEETNARFVESLPEKIDFAEAGQGMMGGANEQFLLNRAHNGVSGASRPMPRAAAMDQQGLWG